MRFSLLESIISYTISAGNRISILAFITADFSAQSVKKQKPS